MGKSKKKVDDEPEETFLVEVITKARVPYPSSDEDDEDDEVGEKMKRKGNKKGKGKAEETDDDEWEYYVKWHGYDSDLNTWEPKANVAGCQRLLASFWDEIGTDNKKYLPGYEVYASDKWIKKEKKYFAKEVSEEKLRAQREREERERRKNTVSLGRPVLYSKLRNRRDLKKKKKKKKSTSTEVVRPFVASSFSKSKSQATSLFAPDSSDDSDDDKPLISNSKRKLGKDVESSDDDDVPLLPARKMMKTDSLTRVATDPVISKATVVKEHGRTTSLFSASSPGPPVQVKKPRPLPPPPPPKSQPSSKKTTPTIPPKLPRRPTNPHARIAEMAPQNIASGSGLSTKQRLGQGALAPTLPKAVSLPAPKQKAPLKTAASAGMSLNKNATTPVLSAGESFATSPITPQSSFRNQESTLAASNAGLSPTIPDFNAPQVMAPPEDYIMHEHDDGPRDFNLSVATKRQIQPPPIVNPDMAKAESFLKSIMPPALAAPLTPAVEQPFEPAPPRPLLPRKPFPQTISKKWTWSGAVFTPAKPSDPVFNVSFFDATEPMQRGMRFSLALALMEHLDFLNFHDAIDLDSILPACQGVHQFARLGPKANEDVQPLQIFSTYMSKMQKIILVPISLDNSVVAHIIFFHHNTPFPTRRFRPPFELQRPGSLVVALVPWTLTSAQLMKHARKPPSAYLPVNTNPTPMFTDTAQWARTIRMKAVYHHALRILNFPQWLHKYMLAEEGHQRTYWVWSAGGDGTKHKVGMETYLLHTIMEQCRAKKPHANLAEARVIFVHVGAVSTLHKLPGFLDLASLSCHVQFYTYGTHESIPPVYWGIREIYPCGGIVTFTPRAILDDPIGVQHRINQIHSHPSWECYVTPAALGMIAKLHCQDENEDPVALFECGTFPYVALLDAIDNGELSLITAPPPQELSPTKNNDPRQEYLKSHWTHRPEGLRAILQSSVDSFNHNFANIQQGNWASMIHAYISKDLALMRCQPVFMKKYRRYVVLESSREGRVAIQDGLEWTTATMFDFKDDFFPKQE